MAKLLQIMAVYLVCGLWVANAAAQEITPRLFWPTPKGTKVLVGGYSYSSGDMLLDLSVPIENAESRYNTAALAYAQTLDLWGRTANVLVEVPYAWGEARGLYLGDPVKREFNAFGDLRVSLNVNLHGAPTMTTEDFLAFRAAPRPLVGLSLKVVAPTGHYNDQRLINTGANRWAGRLKLGAVLPLKPKLLLELSASTSYFGDDDDFPTGKKEQDPIYALEASLIKRIRPGLWASLDMTYYRGGRQSVDGIPHDDELDNLKLGGTIAFPFRRRHAIKIGYASGVITRFGNDFDQLLLSYNVVLK